MYTPHILQQETPWLANIKTIDPSILIDDTGTTIRTETFPFLPENEFTTTDIVREQFKKKFIQSRQRRKILERLAVIAQREDNWDGYDSKKPSKTILAHAKMLIEGMLDTIISGGHPWFTPFISSDEDGFITVAWHIGELELHIEIEENEAEYTKISGTNHDMKMEIDFLNPDNFLILWEWLLDAHK